MPAADSRSAINIDCLQCNALQCKQCEEARRLQVCECMAWGLARVLNQDPDKQHGCVQAIVALLASDLGSA
jgi:hypothetical protein